MYSCIRFWKLLSSILSDHPVRVDKFAIMPNPRMPFMEWHLHRYGRSYGDKRDVYLDVSTSYEWLLFAASMTMLLFCTLHGHLPLHTVYSCLEETLGYYSSFNTVAFNKLTFDKTDEDRNQDCKMA